MVSAWAWRLVRVSGMRVGAMPETALNTFAAELKAWRERMDLTQQAFADKIGYSLALVASVEQCKRSPTLDFAKRCDEATSAPGTFRRWQVQVSRESYPAFFAPVLAFERDAVRIHGWELGAIPGLLQSEGYARALLRSVRQGGDDELERHVQARLERQAILFADKPVELWYVLDEGTLRRMVGGPAVMRDQLDSLIESAASVVLQVLPFTAGDQPGADGPITVYEFAASPAVCYTECYSGGRIVEGQTEVADLMRVVNLLRASALPPDRSLELIRRIRSELDD
jgi:transcriptional regulator with XRE-family HTH domain